MTTRVRTERTADRIAIVTLDGPPLNLNSLASIEELARTFIEIDRDSHVRAVVVTGAGQRIFSAGSDIKEFPALREDIVGLKLERENDAFRRIECCSKPVIAAIEGLALGGGCELAMACDLRIASEVARFGFPELRLGVFPGSGGLYRLPRLVGHARALEMMLLGDQINAAEALRIGLVNRVVEQGQALGKAIELAKQMASSAALAVAVIKRGLRELAQPYEQALELNLALSDQVFRSEDCREGIAAFLEKRTPRFGG
ncbi:MAG: enoyl-CoA hydratase/isomerase family protein [Betaproteobacteria bacterium]